MLTRCSIFQVPLAYALFATFSKKPQVASLQGKLIFGLCAHLIYYIPESIEAKKNMTSHTGRNFFLFVGKIIFSCRA
jgi:hypothetical protein